MSEELKKFRAQIDTIDDELLKLFNHRAKLAQQIGHAKNGSAVLRPEREAQVLQRMVDANAGPLSAQSVSTLFTEIMSHCRALEDAAIVWPIWGRRALSPKPRRSSVLVTLAKECPVRFDR